MDDISVMFVLCIMVFLFQYQVDKPIVRKPVVSSILEDFRKEGIMGSIYSTAHTGQGRGVHRQWMVHERLRFLIRKGTFRSR